MSRTTTLLLIAYLLLTVGISMPKVADAQAISEQCGKNSKISECLSSIKTEIVDKGGLSPATDAPSLLVTIINWLLSLVALLAMVALISGGIMYILSIGEEGKAEKAKKVILNAIIGLIVVIISFVIITTVQRFLTTSSADDFILPGIQTAHAAETGFNAGKKIIEDSVATTTSGLASGETRIYTVIEKVAFFLLGITSIIALVAIIVGGLMYILSIGDENKAEKAKRVILYAIIGIVVVLVSFTVIALAREAITGLTLLPQERHESALAQFTHLAHINTAQAAFIGAKKTDCESGFAAGYDCAKASATKGDISTVGFRVTILTIIKTVLSLVAIIAIAVIIWAGVSYIISLGNEDKVRKAKMMLLYAIIGLVIIGVAIIVVNFVINLFK